MPLWLLDRRGNVNHLLGGHDSDGEAWTGCGVRLNRGWCVLVAPTAEADDCGDEPCAGVFRRAAAAAAVAAAADRARQAGVPDARPLLPAGRKR